METIIPKSEEIQAGSYFLKELNNPACIQMIRLAAAALAVGFLAVWVYILYRKQRERGRKP